MLVQKKNIPMKALTLSYFELEGQGRGIPMEATRPHPFKFFISFFLRLWRPYEVDEVKKYCFISNLPISGSQKSLTFDYSVIKSWKNIHLKCINMSWRTLYFTGKHFWTWSKIRFYLIKVGIGIWTILDHIQIIHMNMVLFIYILQLSPIFGKLISKH